MAAAAPDRAGTSPLLQGDRRRRARLALAALAVRLALTSVAALGVGASGTSVWAALRQLLRGADIRAREAVILFDIRLPRLALGILVGAALAVSGAVMQGLFRNPPADQIGRAHV